MPSVGSVWFFLYSSQIRFDIAMVNCHGMWIHLGHFTPLGMSSRAFLIMSSETFTWRRKILPECGLHIPWIGVSHWLKRKQAEVSPFVSFCLLIVVTFKATSCSPSHQYSSPLWWKLPFLFSDLQTAPGSPWDVCLLTVLCSTFYFLIFQRFGFTALSLSSGMNGPQVPSQSPRAVPRAQEMFCP